MNEHGGEATKRGVWALLTRSRKPSDQVTQAAPEPGSAPGATPLFKDLFGATQATPADTAPDLTLTPAPPNPPGKIERLASPAQSAPPKPAVEVRKPAPPLLRVAPAEYLVPTDLEVTSVGPIRVLAIGSCFLESLLGEKDMIDGAFRIDFALVTHVSQFPASPPAPIGEYDCQLIQIPLRFIMRDDLFLHLDYANVAGYQAAFEECRDLLRLQFDQRMKWNIESGTPTFVLNFMVPQFAGMGRFFPRYDLRNIEYFVSMLNQELERLAGTYRSTYVLDVDRLASSFGRRHLQDDNFTIFGHNGVMFPGLRLKGRIDPINAFGDYYDLAPPGAFARAILAELRAMQRTLRQLDAVKLVVVDVDDTLWNGVSGDSADIGVHMVEGWPAGLVEALQYLRKRGILLAIISKNEEFRVREIWTRIFPNRLRLDEFSAVRINWRPKHENMAEILQAINLLPRNVVFIDDNPAERAQIQAAFPEIRTLGANPYHFRRILLLAPETQPVTVTAESAQRTAMVQSQLQRESDRATLSMETFLAEQNVRLRILRIPNLQHARFPRALELVNKTNQFNTTGKRWTEPECAAFFASGGGIFAYEVEDRYTSYGLVGVVLLRANDIVQWVMSCRVIGLGVEHAAMCELVLDLRRSKPEAISASLIKTDINRPSHDFLRDSGFAQHGTNWVLDAAIAPRRSEHVTVVA